MYTVSYILIVSLIRQLKFNSFNIFFESILKINEDIYLLYFLYVFRPRKFPLYFHLSLDEDISTNLVKLYKISLPNNEQLSQCKDFGKNLIKHNSSDDSPIIVINPIIYSNTSNSLFIWRWISCSKCPWQSLSLLK